MQRSQIAFIINLLVLEFGFARDLRVIETDVGVSDFGHRSIAFPFATVLERELSKNQELHCERPHRDTLSKHYMLLLLDVGQ